MFRKVLIANRGAIACRIIRSLRQLGVSPVAVYSAADRHSRHVAQADQSVLLGPAPASQSYLASDRVLEAARATGSQAIHPGYGFLSENADFAEACETAGVAFIGPTPAQMRAFGLKHTARRLASELDIPVLPGSGPVSSLGESQAEAARLGFPVMLKSSAGGGGIGMRLCSNENELADAFEVVRRTGESSFGDSAMFVEKAILRARHIEVQIFGDGRGHVIAFAERDCSVQRRNQKVIEETPAPGISGGTRERLLDGAVRLGRAVNYRSAGTVEFLYDDSTGDFYFLEVNTRLQVEHGITEEVHGVDLVAWMVQLAAGELPDLPPQAPKPSGWAIQARIYAEDPAKDFAPCSGRLVEVLFPRDARVDTWAEPGAEVTPYYDPLLAKLIVTGRNREEAVGALARGLRGTRLAGIETNLGYLRRVCEDPAFRKGGVTTSFLSSVAFHPQAVEVLAPGTQTTLQDYPGRLGYWHVGVPPSGPMDSLAFRLANRIVGNAPSAAALEITMSGPSLRFRSKAVFAVAGADFGAKLDGRPIPSWKPIDAAPGSVLTLGRAKGAGARAYLAVRGGFQAPRYLGSKSTFILGRFGGHAARAVRAGDILHIGDEVSLGAEPKEPARAAVPCYSREWTVGVLYGPHGAPDYFTPAGIDAFFSTKWRVHYNSDRTGVRLIGPKPLWAREDGGEAGLHPSNIHDNPYAVGAIDFTGDMPVILGPDGPSCGGFVCPATIVAAELWKIGQLRPDDLIQFRPIGLSDAERMELELELALGTLNARLPLLPEARRESAVLLSEPRRSPSLTCRADGDKCLLIEYGPNVLDLDLRFRVHALEQSLRGAGLPGLIDITPGIRSLQIHYHGGALSREALLDAIDSADRSLRNNGSETIPSRIVHLPLSWDDPATRLAIARYTQSVRPDAPWCPSNIEFIRRINGLRSADNVREIVFGASYLVMGLGDVYLGAPVATPIDPRHRLVTTKYNPARTWTPENAVGIGGAYLCVYGMEGPGGYQFVGRTVQMWNTWKSTKDFRRGKPWLLRFFDQIHFYPVTAEELLEHREEFPHGRFRLQVEETRFSLREYHRFLDLISGQAAEFKARQQAAFEAERERWAAAGHAELVEQPALSLQPSNGQDHPAADGCEPVRAPVAANVWTISVAPGQRVSAGDRLVVLEAMKMEVAVSAPRAGVVETLHCKPGVIVQSGQALLSIRVDA